MYYNVIGMTHRGRIVLMATLYDYPASHILRKILGHSDLPKEYTDGCDDVVPLIGLSNKRRFPGTGCKDNDI
jgi:2-oxoglutarate dehydrogenase complex dehydrogenase (E1) component-like enzyme